MKDLLEEYNILYQTGKMNPNAVRLVKKHQKIYDKLLRETSFLPSDVEIIERLYCVINGITQHPVCLTCGTEVKFRKSGLLMYPQYCSKRCVVNGKGRNEKKKKTMMERYGVEFTAQSSNLREKMKRTMVERHGVEYTTQSSNLREKMKRTCVERYGVDNPFKSDQIKQQIKQTNLVKYGSEVAIQNGDVKKKRIRTNREKYGVDYPTQKHIPNHILEKMDSRKWLIKQHHHMKKTLMQISAELGISWTGVINNYFKKHNVEIQKWLQSQGEIQVGEFILSLGVQDVHFNRRDIIFPLELDIFIPFHNVAVEYNGEYWHSFPEQQNRDRIKQNMCKERKICFIVIWEHDWKNNRGVCEQTIIESIFGKVP